MDYQALLYDPIYAAIGVSADLVSNAGAGATVMVIDKTAGVAVADKTQIETVLPVATVRATELATNGIAASDLSGGSITFNGNAWRIKSTRDKPSPNGEADGEVMMILLSEG